MEKVLLGKTGLEVTKVGFGVLTVGATQLNLPIEKGSTLLRYALEKGINFIDTAQYYETYPYIRAALLNTNFNPVICSKSLDPTYNGMIAAIEEARHELDRDVIDIFMLHEVRSEDDFFTRSGAWQALQDMKSKGIIKAIGISTHHVNVANLAATLPECDILFPLINFKSLGIRNGDGPGTKEDMEKAIKLASENGKGIIGMKAFGGGNLTMHYREALDYVYNVEGVDTLMMGFGKEKEVDDILDYLEGKMNPEYVPDVSKKRIHIDQGDCEGCGNCVERCSVKAISINKKTGLAEVDHNRCLTCGYCAPVCPVRAIIMIG